MNKKMANSYENYPDVKYIQKNIRKKHHKYQVRKSVNGRMIIKSFDKLNGKGGAREFLKKLN